MKKNLAMVACALALLEAGTAVAADAPAADGLKAGVYVGADAGWIGYHDNSSGYSVDLSGFAYSLLAGYQFNRYVAVEGAYLGSGNASTNISGADLNIGTHGWQASLVGSLPLSSTGGIYGRLGALRWSANVNSAAAAFSEGSNGTDALYGLGAYLTNGRNLTGRVEVTTASINGTRVYRATLGGYWTF